jgi:hypothetical protein
VAQSTWSADAFTWTNTGNVWANVTYADSVALASNVTQVDSGLANYPSTATLAAESAMTGTGGFLKVAEAVMGLAGGFTPSSQQVFVESIALATTEGLTSVGNKLYVDSITFGTTVNFPLAGTTTWDLDTDTWSNTTSSWGYAPPVALSVAANITQVMLSKLNAEDLTMMPSALLAMSAGVSAGATIAIPVSATYTLTANSSNTGLALMPQSITIAANETFALAEDMVIPVSATLASSETFALAEDMLIPVEVTLATSNTQTGAANAIYVESITVANEQNMKFNINFEESIGLAMASNTTSINNFLWNDVTEDTGSTWTKVSDPDE